MKGFESFKTLSRRVKAILIAFVFVFTAVGVLLPVQRAKASDWTPNYKYLAATGVYNGKICYADCETYGTSSGINYTSLYYGNDTYANVIINSTNFPDEAFRNRIISDFSLTPVYIRSHPGDTPYEAYVITKSNISTNLYATINMSSCGISDVTGIQYFSNLTSLYLLDNSLSEIDLSHNTQLTTLNLNGNNLTSLDVSSNTALTVLRCANNNLNSLIFPTTTNYTTLDISNNNLTGALSVNASNLNAANNGYTSATIGLGTGFAYGNIDISNNELTSFTPLSSHANALFLQGNNLTELDISSSVVTLLDVSDNNISGGFNLNLAGQENLYRNVANNSITSFSGMSWDAMTFNNVTGTWEKTLRLVLEADNNDLTSIPTIVGSNSYYDLSNNDFSGVDVVLGTNLDASNGCFYNLTDTSLHSFTDNSGGVYTIASAADATTYKNGIKPVTNDISSYTMPAYTAYTNKIAGVTSTPTYTLLDSDAYVSSMTNDGFVNLPILGKTSNTWNTVLTLRSDATKSYTSFCIDIGKKCRLNNGYWSSGEYTTTPLVNKIIAAYKNGSLTYQEAQCLIWGAVAGYTSEDNMTTILTDIESTDVATKVSAVTNAVPVTVYFWTNVYGTADYQRLVSELPPTDTTEITIDDPSTWYYVTYDGNGKTEGTVPTDTNKYQESEGFIVKAGTGLKKGESVFAGWNTQPDGNGADYAPGDVCYINNSDLTLYAKYAAPAVYHVTYNANGGTNPPVDPTDYNADDTVTVLSQEAMTNSVKVFNGWNTDPDGNGIGYDAGDTFNITSDTTLYALWADGATVVYEAGDSESGSVPVDNNVYAEGDTITVLGNTGNLAKTGYFFDGWKETVSDITYYKNDTIDDEIYVTTPLRVYTFVPVWSQGYQVVYDANEATGGTVPVDNNYYRSGATAVALGNSGYLVKTGYSFDGWNTKADGTGTPVEVSDTIYPSALDADEAVDHIVTLYAQWGANNYRIVYDGNGSDGGTVPVDNNTYLGTNTAVVLGNSGYLTKGALEFKRWNTRADGMGASFAPSDAICLAAYDEDGDNSVTLYAVWGDNTPVFTVEVPAIVRLTWTDIDDTTGTFSNVYNIVCDASGLNDKTANVRLKNNNPVLSLNNGEDVAVTVSNIQLTKLDGEATYQVVLQTGVLNTADYLGKEYFTDCIFEFEIV